MTTRDETLVERCERLEATVTTWREVFQGIEAHLLDRINMRDPASPQTYLDIIRSDIANINRDSDAIVNARWADRARDSAEIARLTAEVADLRIRNSELAFGRATATISALSAERALAKAREECAKIAENAFKDPQWNGYYRHAGDQIAADIRALLHDNALRALPQAGGGWQPIETAPKGDKFERILLRFDPPFNDPTEIGIAVGAWSGNGWYLTCIWASSSAHRQPTHWQPLPAPLSSVSNSDRGGK